MMSVPAPAFMSDEEIGAPMRKPWVAHKPEQRLSLWFNHFLEKVLLQPCYFTAIHDADGGARTDNQRSRDVARGIRGGQLDWEITQGQPSGPLIRKIELKRGKNKTSSQQDSTIKTLTACGAAPAVAYTIAETHAALIRMGFRLAPTAAMWAAYYEEKLLASDREAAAVMSGAVVKKGRRGRVYAKKPSAARIQRAHRAGVWG